MNDDELHAAVDQLALQIEAQIANQQRALDDSPGFPEGQHIRASPISVDNLSP